MLAVVLTGQGGPEVLSLATVPDPRPGPGEIQIRVAAAGVNRADLLERAGRYPPPAPPPAYPVPGLECAGVVEAVGPGVTAWSPGDRVMALLPGGGYAQRAVVPEGMVLPVPEGVDLLAAGGIPEAFLTAFDALFHLSGAGLGDRVLIHAAASGVGTAAVQLAAAAGMRVAATVGTPAKAEAVRQLGADRVILRREETFPEAVAAWSGGEGVAAVLDFVGADYLAGNLEVLAPGGTLVIIGTLSGTRAGIDLGLLLRRRLTVRGTVLRSRRPEEKAALVTAFRRHGLPLLAAGRVRPVVDRVFPLAEAAAAHRYLEADRNTGKVVLAVPPPA
ncbi:PKS_ER domain-containing protein [Candidatus Hydrogenisulfobacillus filiaventi]|uniref:PKS_ER domain-containing protein n=1 Tax=Candidatus Hydrogenisulfobacillus filiaventi TaxID=2707344 RepID=A0A6F8ZFD0_9FIRM|nr:PKS_ER domain-containing protein [Candidatus Hydrogenisulfobacillus filiaventi]